ncbi:phosphoesterase, partial [Arhodomonas sp. KWT]|uniref:phosphoesterase n=1 Tax=Arhodomonas sp. KWT TaxID=2679915 RepID=UPI000590DF2F
FAITATFLRHGFHRRSLAVLAATVLTAFPQAYTGTQYVSDVLGGAATGIIAAIMVRILYREGSRLDRLLTSTW